MALWEILVIAVGVSIDAFAVSVSGALCRSSLSRWKSAGNAALFFGGFQFFMPLAGFAAASLMHTLVAAFDHWLAFGMLAWVGSNMIWEGCKKEAEEKEKAPSCPVGDFFSCRNLFLPAVATSLDALAVGAGIAFAGHSVWLPATAMGITTGVISAAGVLLGRKLGALAGEKIMMMIGGSAIVLIGLKILLSDLL